MTLTVEQLTKLTSILPPEGIVEFHLYSGIVFIITRNSIDKFKWCNICVNWEKEE